jgi:hypothetical protein
MQFLQAVANVIGLARRTASLDHRRVVPVNAMK